MRRMAWASCLAMAACLRPVSVPASVASGTVAADQVSPVATRAATATSRTAEADAEATDDRSAAAPGHSAGAETAGAETRSAANDDQADPGWPRQHAHDGVLVTLYQPQVERWQGNRLDARAAVAVRTASGAEPSYGVVSFSARSAVDKPGHVALLVDVVVRGAIPALAATEEAAVRAWLPEAVRRVTLDPLQASLAASIDAAAPETTQVRNDAPRVVVTTRPAVLVVLDGPPALRPVAGTHLLRAINTRALLVFDAARRRYYLYLGDCWMNAAGLAGPWTQAVFTPPALDLVRRAAVDAQAVDLLDDRHGRVQQQLAKGTVPRVVVATTPTELIELDGAPRLEPLPGTNARVVANTDAALFATADGRLYYALLSGRWYRSAALLDGAWSYVATPPGELARLDPLDRHAWVLAAIPGTREARKAAVAHEVAQTATVRRGPVPLTIAFDGAPRELPIDGTALRYVVNSATPVLHTDLHGWYALQDGVWLVAATPHGPWQVATTVPQEIYDIPPSSRLHHVTYARIYGVDGAEVHVGYTPGYLGSYVGDEGTVVYGTGYATPGWRGTLWIPAPSSFGAGMRWSSRGGWVAARRASDVLVADRFRHAVDAATRAQAGDAGDLDHIDVYRFWPPQLVTEAWQSPRPAARTPPGGRRPPNDVYAGRDGQVYRPGADGWERFDDQGWRPVDPGVRSASASLAVYPSSIAELDRERMARRDGDLSAARAVAQ